MLFSILVEMAAKAAKQDPEKEKMRKPEEGTARIAAICWFCAFLLSFVTSCSMPSTGTLELSVIYSYTGGRVGDETA